MDIGWVDFGWVDFGGWIQPHFRSKFCKLNDVNCCLLSKTSLNVYRPTSPILSLPGTSCKLPSSTKQCRAVLSSATEQCYRAVLPSSATKQCLNQKLLIFASTNYPKIALFFWISLRAQCMDMEQPPKGIFFLRTLCNILVQL